MSRSKKFSNKYDQIHQNLNKTQISIISTHGHISNNNKNKNQQTLFKTTSKSANPDINKIKINKP